jgi:hypothetical protein
MTEIRLSNTKTKRLIVPLMALLLFGLPNRVSGDCLMYQECTNPLPQPNMPACRPRQLPAPIQPFSLLGYPVRACPQYDIGCCTLDQNLLLYASLMQVKPLFGNLADGGCPACYQNMQQFWCAYTCGPNQSDYLTILGAANVTSPENGETYEVLRTKVSFHKAFAYDTYSSCESVKSVEQISAMSNITGFFNFQGQYEAIQHGTFIEFDLNSSSPLALNLPAYTCCNFPIDFGNTSRGNMSCPCQSCKGMCPGNSSTDQSCTGPSPQVTVTPTTSAIASPTSSTSSVATSDGSSSSVSAFSLIENTVITATSTVLIIALLALCFTWFRQYYSKRSKLIDNNYISTTIENPSNPLLFVN